MPQQIKSLSAILDRRTDTGELGISLDITLHGGKTCYFPSEDEPVGINATRIEDLSTPPSKEVLERFDTWCKFLNTRIEAWYRGEGHIQNMLGDLSAEVREFLISGTTPEEWAALFPEESRDAR